MALEEKNIDLKIDLEKGNSEQLAALIRIAMGTDTLDTFVKKTGLSKGMLSRLMNSKALNPRRSTLEKIANANQNGVRLNDLLKSAGLPEDPTQAPGLEIVSEIQLAQLRRQVEMRNVAMKQTALIVAQNYLISCGKTHLISKYDDGEFSITVDNQEFVGIPVFETGRQLGEITGDVIKNVLELTKTVKEKIEEILIITGFPEVYDHLVSVFSELNMNPTILYTNDNISVTKKYSR